MSQCPECSSVNIQINTQVIWCRDCSWCDLIGEENDD